MKALCLLGAAMLMLTFSCGSPERDLSGSEDDLLQQSPDGQFCSKRYLAWVAINHTQNTSQVAAVVTPKADALHPVFQLMAAEPTLEFHQLIAKQTVDGNENVIEAYANDLGISTDLVYPDVIAVVSLGFRGDSQADELLEGWRQAGHILAFEPDRMTTPDIATIRIPEHSQATAVTSQVNRSTIKNIGYSGDLSLLQGAYSQSVSAWWHQAINLYQVFQLTSLGSAQPVVVAVFDSGVDHLHPALKGRMWANPRPGAAGCLDDRHGCNTAVRNRVLGDGRAYPFGSNGYGKACPHDMSTGQERPLGDCFHGTHVAGIIAGNVHEGVTGVCPHCQVVNVKVVESIAGQAKVTDSSIIKGLRYVQLLRRQLGVPIRVVNSSFGKFHRSRSLAMVIEMMAQTDPDLLIVASAGNEDSQHPVYPAANHHVLAVSAAAHDYRKATYANYGVWVDLVAPGGDYSRFGLERTILSAVPGGQLDFSQGTSMATPMVSAVAALLFSYYPELNAADVKSRLMRAANPAVYKETSNLKTFHRVIQPEGREVYLLGAGILDAGAAMANLEQATPRSPLDLGERVRGGCGTIGLHSGSGVGVLMSFFAVLLVLVANLMRFCLAGRTKRDS